MTVLFCFYSCKEISPCILDCHLEDEVITIKLNATYKIGEITGGRVGDSFFYNDNFIIEKNNNEISIKFNNVSVFENGVYYKIGVEWLRGNVNAIAIFENNKFVVKEEEYYKAKYL